MQRGTIVEYDPDIIAGGSLISDETNNEHFFSAQNVVPFGTPLFSGDRVNFSLDSHDFWAERVTLIGD